MWFYGYERLLRYCEWTALTNRTKNELIAELTTQWRYSFHQSEHGNLMSLTIFFRVVFQSFSITSRRYCDSGWATFFIILHIILNANLSSVRRSSVISRRILSLAQSTIHTVTFVVINSSFSISSSSSGGGDSSICITTNDVSDYSASVHNASNSRTGSLPLV